MADTATGPEASHQVAVPPKKSGGNNKTLIIVLVIVFIVFVLPGLVFGAFVLWFSRGDGAEKITESIIEQSSGGQVDVDSNDGSFTIENDDGSFSVGGDQDLPEGFPSEVAIYPNQTIKGSFRASDGDSATWSVTAESSDSASDVSNFFDDKFSSWKNDGEYSVNGATTTSYTKGDLTAVITITKGSESDKTAIGYNIQKDK